MARLSPYIARMQFRRARGGDAAVLNDDSALPSTLQHHTSSQPLRSSPIDPALLPSTPFFSQPPAFLLTSPFFFQPLCISPNLSVLLPTTLHISHPLYTSPNLSVLLPTTLHISQPLCSAPLCALLCSARLGSVLLSALLRSVLCSALRSAQLPFIMISYRDGKLDIPKTTTCISLVDG